MNEVTMESLHRENQLKVAKMYPVLLAHLRAGGLKPHRRGSEGEILDEFPRNPGEDFSIELVGDRDYHLLLGQRTEGSPRGYAYIFCRLEHLGRKRGKCWVEMSGRSVHDRWHARADKTALQYTMKHPFGVLTFSSDYLAVSTSNLGSMIYEGSIDKLLGAMARIFETGQL